MSARQLWGLRLACLAVMAVMAVLLARGFATPLPAALVLADPWGQALLVDAALALGVLWGWIAWRERRWPVRMIWLVLIAGLGMLAVAAYIALTTARLRPGTPARVILVGQASDLAESV